MTFVKTCVLAGLLISCAATVLRAEPSPVPEVVGANERNASEGAPTASPSPSTIDVSRKETADEKIADAIRDEMKSALVDDDKGLSEDRAALSEFYDTRNAQPLWVTGSGVSDRGRALAGEIENAAAYGLDPKRFKLPDFSTLSGEEALGRADYQLTLAALTYARDARGGRIPDLARMLNSNLDRKPQLHKPKTVLEKLTNSDDVAVALTELHPVHPQFEKLRQAFLKKTRDRKGTGKLSHTAKRLRANMEFWRWMWDDLGELYVFNNLPQYMQHVVKDGEIVRSERIVVGELDKQSSVFSRPLDSVVLRPRWRVPESIMVHELWPSLLRGGGLMRSYGLEITTKSGEKRNWRKIDWSKDDIRNYHVWQPPGPRSVLGVVKFSFPSQHTIFMHDTPDKWMFRKRTRTLSHGCLRVRNPLGLAEIVLKHDKGWDKAKIKKLIKSGPLDNVVKMDKHIPIHLAYFTAWVDDKGKVNFFRDIYGHEKRVRQALDGDWKKINKGRNHLAPAKPRFDPEKVARSSPKRRRKKEQSVGALINRALGVPF